MMRFRRRVSWRAELGVSRNTVLVAYELLLAEGYVVGRGGAGTFVAHNAVRPQRKPPTVTRRAAPAFTRGGHPARLAIARVGVAGAAIPAVVAGVRCLSRREVVAHRCAPRAR